MKDKKEMIRNFLKETKMASTGKIASSITSNQYDTEKYLNELEKANEVNRTSTPNATYWELKKKKSKE